MDFVKLFRQALTTKLLMFLLGASVVGNVVVYIEHKHAYGNDQLHEWASLVVINHFSKEKSGAYDLCLAHSETWPTEPGGLPAETGLSLDYPEDVVNACAIVLLGAEW